MFQHLWLGQQLYVKYSLVITNLQINQSEPLHTRNTIFAYLRSESKGFLATTIIFLLY